MGMGFRKGFPDDSLKLLVHQKLSVCNGALCFDNAVKTKTPETRFTRQLGLGG